MNYTALIKEIGRGTKGARPMDQASAEALFAAILAQQVPDLELGAILLSLRIKGETADEIAGFMSALDAATQPVALPEGPRLVVFPSYNGGRKEANLMPLVALLLAREGVPVLIHGYHDFDNRVDPLALLAALELPVAASLPEAASQLATRRLSVVPVAQLCPGLVPLLALRTRLGVRNCGHTLAKLVDPCPGRSVRVIPLTHPHFLETLQPVLAAKGATALLMRGTEGEAYANPRRRPDLLGFRQGAAELLFPQESLPLPEGAAADCSIEANVAVIRAMLAGEIPVPQPIRDQVAALQRLATA